MKGAPEAMLFAYNSRQPSMANRPRTRARTAALFVAPFLLVSIFLTLSDIATAQERPAQAPKDLARKIMEKTGPGTIYLEFNVVEDALTKGEAAEARRALETELGARGARLAGRNSAAAAVTVTVAENTQGEVWVAQVKQGAGEPVVILMPVERSSAPPPPRGPASNLTIRKSLLWTQEQPILDVARVEGGPAQHLLVLDPYHVTLYRWNENKWDPEQVLGVYHARPWPREVRGRLVLRRDRLFDAYLPGVVCASSNGAPISMTCREADDPWPLSEAQQGQSGFFSPVRNFFNGTLVPGLGGHTTTAPFYDVVTLPRPGGALWITTALDGSVHLLDGGEDQAIRTSWGTAITAVRSNCGSGWQVLASGSGDFTAADTVTPVEFAERAPTVAGEAAEFPGPVMELWDTNDPATAVAVVRNLETNLYEAYALSVACGQ